MKKSSRVTASDSGMASNIIYGHPTGDGSLREWTPSDLTRSYNIGYRWAAAILRLRDAARHLGLPGVRPPLGTTGEAAVKWYARQIAAIRGMRDPEGFVAEAPKKRAP